MLRPAICHRGRERPGAVSFHSFLHCKERPTLVPPTKMPPRAPLGPSVVLMAGIPLSGIAFVLQKSAAVSSETCDC
jgi:hypothetical protein